jgi:hypothetical protein
MEKINHLHGASRLAERGVLKNEGAVVTSLVSKDEVQVSESRENSWRKILTAPAGLYCGLHEAKGPLARRSGAIKKIIDAYGEE